MENGMNTSKQSGMIQNKKFYSGKNLLKFVNIMNSTALVILLSN